MKKYKLIKEFPDGPELGQVAEFQEGNNNYFIKGSGFGTLCYRYAVRLIEENPEFWEEVKEKEWEIVRLERTNGVGGTITKNVIEQYQRNNSASLWCDLWKIHSIKRLSDGEVFTIGDTIYSPNILQSNEATIVSFELRGESILVKSNWHVVGIDLRNAKKIEKKEPILTTEDEVHLYERDQYWTVFDQLLLGIEPFKIYGPHTVCSNNTFASNCKFFAKKENAERYIQENKPKTVYGVNGSFTKTATSLENKTKDDYAAGDWRWFNSEKERDNYIEENKPRFNQKDMMSFGKYVGARMTFTDPLKMFSDWSNQVRKEK